MSDPLLKLWRTLTAEQIQARMEVAQDLVAELFTRLTTPTYLQRNPDSLKLWNFDARYPFAISFWL